MKKSNLLVVKDYIACIILPDYFFKIVIISFWPDLENRKYIE